MVSRRKRKLVLAGMLLVRLRSHRRRNRTMWMRPWVQRRNTQGVFHNLVQELEAEDPEMYRKYFRVSPEDFRIILGKVEPYIVKQDTRMRQAVTPAERLAVTLRFLATGKTTIK